MVIAISSVGQYWDNYIEKWHICPVQRRAKNSDLQSTNHGNVNNLFHSATRLKDTNQQRYFIQKAQLNIIFDRFYVGIFEIV